MAEKLWNKLSDTVEQRSMAYVNKYIKTQMQIASIIFDRQRKIGGVEILVKTILNY